MATLPPTPLTTIHRIPARGSYDRATVEAILDEGLWCSVGLIQDGHPIVLPMVYARRGRELLLHGAQASRLVKAGAGGLPLCATVTLLDGVVLARSAFHHSMNYRSVVVVGTARELTDPAEKAAALTCFVEHILPGRAAEVRAPSSKELAATRVLALPIEAASAKIRTGGPLDDPEDESWPCWAGHIPLVITARSPIPTSVGQPVGEAPAAIAAFTRPRRGE